MAALGVRLRRVLHVLRSGWLVAAAWAGAVIGIGGFITYECWDWLIGDANRSAVVRNVVLVLASLIGLPVALWRSWIAQRQAATAEGGLLNERYQKAAEMLGHEHLSVRLGGVYALARMAEEHPVGYHLQIAELFCAYVRHPPPVAGKAPRNRKRAPRVGMGPLDYPQHRTDIAAIMKAMGTRSARRVVLEKRASTTLSFSGADLRGLGMRDLNFAHADFSNADLSFTDLRGADFSHCTCWGIILTRAMLGKTDFAGANLSNARLDKVIDCYGANFSDAVLHGARLVLSRMYGAKFHRARLDGANIAETRFHQAGNSLLVEGLTMAQLVRCRPRPPHRSPHLDGLVDQSTGQKMNWPRVAARPAGTRGARNPSR